MSHGSHGSSGFVVLVCLVLVAAAAAAQPPGVVTVPRDGGGLEGGLVPLPGDGGEQCTVILTGHFVVGTDLLSPRPSIPLLNPSTCVDCGSAYQCTEGSDANTPNRYNLHAVAPEPTQRCLRVDLAAACVGLPGNNNLGSAAWLSPFIPNGDKCDATKLGTVGAPSPWPPRDGSYAFALPANAGADIIVFEQKGGPNPPQCTAGYDITVQSCECPVPVGLLQFDVEP